MSNSVYDSIPNFSEMNHNTVFENRPKSSLKIPKMDDFGELLKTSSLRSKSFTRQVSLNKKSKCDILGDFQTLCTNQSSK